MTVEIEWNDKELAREFGIDPEETKQKVKVRDAIAMEIVRALEESGEVGRSDLEAGSNRTQSDVLRAWKRTGLLVESEGSQRYEAGRIGNIE